MLDVGFGIIGCGFAASIHAKAIKSTEQGKLLGVYDVDEKKVKEFAEKYNVQVYTDLEKFLAQDDIQIVSICTPSNLHASLGVQVARTGKHLVIEKPLDVTPERCDAVIDAAHKNRVKLTVISQHRFKEAVQILRSALEEGRFGKLVLGNALVRWYRSPEYYRRGGWKGTKKYDGGGALINQSIHTIDLLQWMMGPVKEIQSEIRTLVHDIEVEDTALAILEFENGALGLIEGTTSIYPGFDECLEIYGENGSACVEGNKIVTWDFKEEKEEDKKIRLIGQENKTGGAREATGISIKYHRRQIEDMINAVLSNRKPLIDGEEGKKAVEIIHRIYKVSK